MSILHSLARPSGACCRSRDLCDTCDPNRELTSSDPETLGYKGCYRIGSSLSFLSTTTTYLLLLIMPTRSGLRLSRPTPPPTCSHCGARGHINTVCPRSSYSPDIPALTCPHCIRTVRSGQGNEPDSTQIVVTIDLCSTHSSPVVRPSPPHPPPPYTPAAPTAPVARDICNRNLSVLRTLHASGEALPPKKLY